MNVRLKGFGLGSKRKSSANNPATPQPSPSSPQLQGPLPGRPGPHSASSSTHSLPMSHPGAGGRPPSYTPGYVQGGRTTSPPMPPGSGNPRTPPSQVIGGPPPIHTAAGYPPPNGPAPVGAPPMGGPPVYGGAPYPPPGLPGAMAPVQYAARNTAVEVEGAGRSKSQLIVGIDFVSLLNPFECTTIINGDDRVQRFLV
jgi:hypothetical protein